MYIKEKKLTSYNVVDIDGDVVLFINIYNGSCSLRYDFGMYSLSTIEYTGLAENAYLLLGVWV
jgi:hypothetical protein